MGKRGKTSLLAQTLRGLMDVSGQNQKDWAHILGVTSPAITQWLNDETLPKAVHINSIVDVVRRLDGTEKAIRRFYKIAELPAKRVTPHHRKVRKNVGHYVAEHLFKGAHRRIDAMVFRNSLQENEEMWRKIAEFLSLASF